MTISTKAKQITTAVAITAVLSVSGCGAFHKELRTEIEINSTPEKVWATLMDFEQFPSWNPMIRKVTGEAVVGKKLNVFVQAKGTKGMGFKPTVLKVDQNREFRWLGKVGMRGIFDGQHVFTIQPIDVDTIRFVHREEFSGVMVPLAIPVIADDTLRGFNDMNNALKRRVEQSQ